MQPTLALHLQEYGYEAVFIGFSFAIPTLIYASTTPIVYVITGKMKKQGVIFLGYCIICMAMLLIGPSLMFNFENTSVNTYKFNIIFIVSDTSWTINDGFWMQYDNNSNIARNDRMHRRKVFRYG